MINEDTVEFTTPLAKAIAVWSQGRRISLTLATQLLQEGYDLASLERRHFKTR
jgi:hypothetical protein